MIAFVQLGLGPLVAGHNFAVQFNRDSVLLHTEMLDEGAQRGGGKYLRFPIDHKIHPPIFSVAAEMGQAQQRRGIPSTISERALATAGKVPALLSQRAARSSNFRVAVRPAKLACTSTEELGKDSSAT